MAILTYLTHFQNKHSCWASLLYWKQFQLGLLTISSKYQLFYVVYYSCTLFTECYYIFLKETPCQNISFFRYLGKVACLHIGQAKYVSMHWLKFTVESCYLRRTPKNTTTFLQRELNGPSLRTWGLSCQSFHKL